MIKPSSLVMVGVGPFPNRIDGLEDALEPLEIPA